MSLYDKYRNTGQDPKLRQLVTARDHERRIAKIETKPVAGAQTVYAEDLAEISTTGTSGATTPNITVDVQAGQVVSIYFECEMKASDGTTAGAVLLTGFNGLGAYILGAFAPGTSYAAGQPFASAPGKTGPVGVQIGSAYAGGGPLMRIAPSTGSVTFTPSYGRQTGAGTIYFKNRKLWIEVR